MKLRKYIVTIIDDGSKQSAEYIRELECQWGADEIETCEDAVSRESVGSMLNNIKMRGSEFWIDYYKKALIGLLQLPSVEPKPIFYPPCKDCNAKMDEVRKAYDRCRWVPVSERLPEEFDDVLCSTDAEEVFIATYLGKMDDGIDCFNDNDGMMWKGDVIAWMPLPPKPYKESDVN